MRDVRIICRTCNLTRPKDGSDLGGHQPTLWAQDLTAAQALAAPTVRPRERQTPPPGRASQLAERERRAAVGREAARLRAGGRKWREISEELGLPGPASAYQAAWRYGDQGAHRLVY